MDACKNNSGQCRAEDAYLCPAFLCDLYDKQQGGVFTKGYCNFLLFLLKVPQSKFFSTKQVV